MITRLLLLALSSASALACVVQEHMVMVEPAGEPTEGSPNDETGNGTESDDRGTGGGTSMDGGTTGSPCTGDGCTTTENEAMTDDGGATLGSGTTGLETDGAPESTSESG